MTDHYRLHDLLVQIYGRDAADATAEKLFAIIETHRPNIPARENGVSQRDTFLITYPDQVRDGDAPSLAVLSSFARQHFSPFITTIHLLPFYPWTSDDGFAVADYRDVAVGYGSWQDVRGLGADFRLMFDAVINHASTANAWFQGFLAGDPRYRNYFLVPPDGADLSKVVRPRALPLLTSFETAQGVKKVWTTFSTDQVDLNYQNPEVLLEIVDVLLFYAEQGADFLRLDAIAYLWKEYGTSSIHLPQTHALIKLFRAILDDVAPYVSLVTETNVPHHENIAYFGNGLDEARMVYNFPLPPLVLHAIQTGSALALTKWAQSLLLPSDQVTFLNFLASHDGIGLNPLRGLVSQEEVDLLVEQVKAYGGLISYKQTAESEQPYELNINYFDALNGPAGKEPLQLQVDRFLAAHAVLFCMPGVPAVYFHSLVGWRGWPQGVAETRRNRTINRQKFQRQELEAAIAGPGTQQAQVFQGMSRLLKARAERAAFHPYGSWKVLSPGDAVFGILRVSPDGSERVLCLQNLSGQHALVPGGALAELRNSAGDAHDIIAGSRVAPDREYRLAPYETLWLA